MRTRTRGSTPRAKSTLIFSTAVGACAGPRISVSVSDVGVYVSGKWTLAPRALGLGEGARGTGVEERSEAVERAGRYGCGCGVLEREREGIVLEGGAGPVRGVVAVATKGRRSKEWMARGSKADGVLRGAAGGACQRSGKLWVGAAWPVRGRGACGLLLRTACTADDQAALVITCG